jgi:tRNA nucleotidyltransferase/poly(A) polymerase
MTAIEIIKILHTNKFEVYFVGGCVRDMILGLKSKDYDIVTNATPDEISSIFKNYKCSIKEVGKSFGVLLINDIEVATYRTDEYNGLDDKSVQINFTPSLQEDLARRDLTINSIAYDPIKDKIIDYHNGREDLEKKIIRFIGDPHKRIFEDPNRIIRACRFKAKIDGEFESETFKALKEYSSTIESHVNPERIRLEILKAMEIKKASIFFESLHSIGGLEHIFPSMTSCYNHPHGPHHVEDIFTHLMLSGDSAPIKNKLVKLSAYLHDVGKPLVCKINPRTNDYFFLDHAHIGAKQLKEELLKLTFSSKEINFITGLTDLHMRVMPPDELTQKCIRRILRILNERSLHYKDLLRVNFCDTSGRYNLDKKKRFYKTKKLNRMFKIEVNRPNQVGCFNDLELDGNDIQEILNIKPSKIIGEILNYLMDQVLENPELNNKEDLTKIIKEFYEEKSNVN